MHKKPAFCTSPSVKTTRAADLPACRPLFLSKLLEKPGLHRASYCQQRRDLYVEFLNEVIAHVRAKGFQVRVWNDGLFRPDLAEHVELDRNVQIGFWSNWDKGMAPLQAFLDRGYQVVNYHSEYLYFILLIRQDYKEIERPGKYPEVIL